MKTVLALLLALAALPAAADIPDPSIVECQNKAPGDTCKQRDGKEGVCTRTTCSRYRPGGTVTFDCVRCDPKPPEDPKKAPEKTVPEKTGPEKKGAWNDGDSTPTRLAGAGVGLLALGLGLFAARRAARRRTE